MLVRVPIRCNDEDHHISVWEAGDEEACGSEHLVIAETGNIICYEDREVELDLTISDLTGESPDCLEFMQYVKWRIEDYIVELNFDMVKLIVFSFELEKDKTKLALRAAIRASELQMVMLVIENTIKDQGTLNTIFVFAAGSRNVDIESYLLSKGADIHHGEEAALYQASEAQDAKMTLFLLQHGADPLVRRIENEILSWAVTGDEIPLAKHVLRSGFGTPMSHGMLIRTAAQFGYVEMVELLLKYAPDYHKAIDQVLSKAAETNQAKLIKHLYGNRYFTKRFLMASAALFRAVDYVSLDVVRLLAKIGIPEHRYREAKAGAQSLQEHEVVQILDEYHYRGVR